MKKREANRLLHLLEGSFPSRAMNETKEALDRGHL